MEEHEKTDAQETAIINAQIDEQKSARNNFEKNKRFLVRLFKKEVDSDRDYVICVSGAEGEGKTLIKGSKILMASGEWKNVEDIKVDDLVLSPQHDGTHIPSRVKETHSWFCNETYDIIELNRNNNKLYTCSNNHLIPINKCSTPRVDNKKNKRKRKWKIKNIEAREYAKKSFNYKQNSTSLSSFPINKFFTRENCEIEPYTLGAWLGDGHFTCNLGITSNNKEIIDEISKFYDVMSIGNKKGTTCKTYRFSCRGILARHLVNHKLRGKKSGTKFIPKEALLSDIEYRKRLLAGLIDTDGYLSKTQSYSITTKSEQLSEDIKFLIHTLGGRCNIRKVKKGIKKTGFIGEYYHVSFYLGDINIPFKIKKKKRNDKFFYKSSNRISIDAIPSKPEMVYGFTLDSPSGWHIVNEDFMITHNSAGAIELAMACAGAFHPDRQKKFIRENVVYDPTSKELFDKIDNLKIGGVLVIDEGMKSFYKRDYASKGRKSLNILFSKIRSKNLIIFICIPDFFDLDKYLRQWRIKSWIYIPYRGLGMLFKKSNSPFSDDKWSQKVNQKAIDQMELESGNVLASKSQMIENLRMLKSHGLDFSFNDFNDAIKSVYLQYKEWGGTKAPDIKPEDEEKSIPAMRKKFLRNLFTFKMLNPEKTISDLTNEDIGNIYGISEKTVSDYTKDIRKKINEKENSEKKKILNSEKKIDL